MKTKLITFLLVSMSLLGMGQTPDVQKLINGKPCDTCFAKNDMSFSKILPVVFIGTYTNPGRLSNELDDFKKSIPKDVSDSHCYLITDSSLNMVFITELHNEYLWPIGSPEDKNYDYKKVEILIEKNQKILKNWQILDKLLPIDGYKINRVNCKTTHQTGDIQLDYEDLLTVTLRQAESKEIIRKLYIKRILDKPAHFVYYQASVNTGRFKKSLQSFLNESVPLENVGKADTANSFTLKRNNIGVLSFNDLVDGEEIEYTIDKMRDWKVIRQDGKSPFEKKFIILDNEDIPPGEKKKLYLRYKNQPKTEIIINIRGIEDITQTSLFNITAGFMLAALLFGSLYYFRNRNQKRKLARLHQKNKDIETQLSLLSGQLNPHFLFNSLHAIQGTIIKNDIETANTYISDVAGFIRRVMDDGKKEFISLGEELTLEEDYLKLEQKRTNFSYKIDICSSLNTTEIDFPPLLLQPVLENSIRHGLAHRLDNPSIEINIKKEGKNLIVNIIDNGLFWDVTKINEGQGISLIKKRMLIYNEKLTPIEISMNAIYSNATTIVTFIFKNWLV